MLRSTILRAIVVLVGLSRQSFAQTWCGKNYKKTSSPVSPGGQFPVPATSSSPLLALRCAQAIRPYLPEDTNSVNDPTAVSVLIDAPVVFSKISNSAAITIPNGSLPDLSVTVTVNGTIIASGGVPLNSTKHALPFSLSSLTPTQTTYTMTCTATLSGQTFSATGKLTYLPDPPAGIGSVTKMDQRTGALLARPANGLGGPFAPVFPIGYYTEFDTYLANDLTIPAQLAALGYTTIHPNPPFTNMTAFDLMLDKMQEAGLYLIYDMRYTYMDTASVTTQVNHVKSRPNVLLWYTADEPDGTSDPLDATAKAYNLITSLDGGDGIGGAGYHPVGLVLNCQDYQWSAYAAGSDVVMQDAYMIGNNVTFSTVWGTPCTSDYGDCGCDNCQGAFEDISSRMDSFKERLFINAWDRTKSVWTVPQGFGNETYWKRYPTGQEWVVESVLGINHGGLGVVSWEDPTTADIKSSGSKLALALQQMSTFILSSKASFRQVTIDRVDIGLWTIGSQTLVLGTNLNYTPQTIKLSQLDLPATGTGAGFTQVLDTGAELDGARNHLLFTPVGTGAWVVNV